MKRTHWAKLRGALAAPPVERATAQWQVAESSVGSVAVEPFVRRFLPLDKVAGLVDVM